MPDTGPLPPSQPSAPGFQEGVESAVWKHHRAMTLPPPPKSRFIWNLTLIVAVGLLGTFWFLRHLQPWFTEIAIVGGGVTLWAALRLVLELLNKAGGVDPWASTRKHLASPEWTVFLATAVLVVVALWALTASIYLRFDPGSAKTATYKISVGTVDATGTFSPSTELSAAQPVVGRPVFGWTPPGALVCRIESPAKFEELPCSLERWGARVVRVPGSFKLQSLLLLRLLPAKELWTQLPTTDVAQPPQRFDLVLRLDGLAPMRLSDVRFGAIDLGAPAADLKALAAEQSSTDLRVRLHSTLLAEGVPEPVIAARLSALVDEPRTWDGVRIRPGQILTLELHVAAGTSGEASTPVPGFPVTVTVGSEPFQTVWLRPKETK